MGVLGARGAGEGLTRAWQRATSLQAAPPGLALRFCFLRISQVRGMALAGCSGG